VALPLLDAPGQAIQAEPALLAERFDEPRQRRLGDGGREPRSAQRLQLP